jgi:CHASE3 domain sensor protein
VIRRVAIGILVISAVLGVLLGVALHRAHDALVTAQLDVATALSQMATTASEINAAQQAYVAPGQPDQPWLARVGELVQQLAQSAATIRPQLRSPEAADHLQTLTGAVDSLVAIDGRVRTHLANGQDLSAADLVFTEARDTVGVMVEAIRGLEATERAATDAERAALTQQAWALAGFVGVLWIAAVVVLLRGGMAASLDVRPAPAEASTFAPRPADSGHYESTPLEIPAATQEEPASAPSIDLATAAAVCIDLSRVTSVDALPDLLARASIVLDASGLILWMGAGEELFAVTAHGYDPKVLARLGPIARHANNATAAAWRSGEVGTVPGDMVSNGAIVAPMWGVDGCIGVLAAEIRHGRESDPAAAAVTSMFAAQLATIVSAWPAPSEAESAAG